MKWKNEFFDIVNLKRNEKFRNIMEKLITNTGALNFSEKSFLLSSAILLIKKFESKLDCCVGENEQKGYLELAYALILQYSFKYQDVEPLNDFCIGYGFYPVVDALDKLKGYKNISEVLTAHRIKKEYTYNDFIETKQQKLLRRYFFSTKAKTVCLSAPTSFGKSEFIAVFTQERAIRFISEQRKYFDMVYVDEAHNIFDDNYRSIVLYRFLKLNALMNLFTKFVFISPIIQDYHNLTGINNGNIDGRSIDINIKEPRISLFENNGNVYAYNRFLNEFYLLNKYKDYWSYINSVEKDKNFIFLVRPLNIEKFSKSYCYKRKNISSEKIDEIIDNIQKYVHDDFFEIDCLRHGFVYLHAKVPDQIKEYLLFKFATVKELSALVANSVILEGVNLPIDCLFVLSARGVSRGQIVNLMGRVNRLKYVFRDNKNIKELLNKLMPPVHFVETGIYSKNGTLRNKIKELHKEFLDDVRNPLLDSFEGDENDVNSKKIRETNKIFFMNKDGDGIVQKFLVAGLDSFFDVRTVNFDKLSCLIGKYKQDHYFKNIHYLDKVFELFFNKFKIFAIDTEVSRLKNRSAIQYYKYFCDNKNLPLHIRIEKQIKYLMLIRQSRRSIVYIGTSFGEIGLYDRNKGSKVYVDLKNKGKRDIINIAIIKQKIEDDFVNYKLSRFFQFLKDCDLLTDDEYACIRYGTKDNACLSLIKNGVPAHLAIKLKNEGQILNLGIKNGMIKPNNDFLRYFDKLDDFCKFEIGKYINVDFDN